MTRKQFFYYADRLIIVFVVLLLVYGVFFNNHTSVSNQQSSFLIAQPYEQVCAKLILTDCSKRIIEKQHGKIITSNWNRFHLGLRDSKLPLLSRLDLKFNGQFSVYINNDIIGKQLFFFNRKISIDKTFIVIDIDLDEPHDALHDYFSRIILINDNGATKVKTQVCIKYRKNIPITHVGYMDRQVEQETIKALNNLNSGLIEAL